MKRRLHLTLKQHLSNFPSNKVKNLEIPKFGADDSVTQVSSILKYKSYPRFIVILKCMKNKILHFKEVITEEIEKEILKLGNTNTSQKTIFPLELYKKILTYLQIFIHQHKHCN